MEFQIHTDIEEINRHQWDNLVKSSNVATFFQSQGCYDFYKSLSFLKPFVFGVSENGNLKGIVVGYLISDGNFIKRFFSKRAIIPGGVLFNDISEKGLSILLETTKKILSTKSIYIEFRNYNSYEHLKKIFENSGFNYQPHLNFQIKTPSLDIVLKNLSSTKRRDIKVSQKNGAVWYESKFSDDLKEFYSILCNLYKTKIKTPLFQYEFFETLISKPFSKFFVIKYKNEVVGGNICVFQNEVIYEWFVCGLDGKYKNIYPSTLATWAAIEYASINGFKTFDMMGAGKPDEGYGVRDFKSKFGGELVEHGRFLYVSKPILYKLGKWILTILKSIK
jgi:predicted N-acyltransferase